MSNPEFHKEYSTLLLNEVIERGYAEQSPDRPGKVWYIPHHGVHHPKKGSLQVVFDGGATYQARH